MEGGGGQYRVKKDVPNGFKVGARGRKNGGLEQLIKIRSLDQRFEKLESNDVCSMGNCRSSVDKGLEQVPMHRGSRDVETVADSVLEQWDAIERTFEIVEPNRNAI